MLAKGEESEARIDKVRAVKVVRIILNEKVTENAIHVAGRAPATVVSQCR